MRMWISSETPDADGVRLLRAADCDPQPVHWLWRYWLPASAISILAGAPGTGKTTLALAIASIVSTGGHWPDGTLCTEAQNVVIWSGEDDVSTTLIPRLIAMDADLARVHFVTLIQDQGRMREFDPAADMLPLMEKMAEIGGAGLVIVDPMISAISGDAHRANDVRRDLHDLVVMARSGPAVLGISHFAKGGGKSSSPLDRVIGSQAFSAVARMVWLAARRQGQDVRVLARAKSNFGLDGGGYEYRVNPFSIGTDIETSGVAWGDVLDGDAQTILADAEQEGSVPSRVDDAKTFLTRILTGVERMASSTVHQQAAAAGHSQSTLNRAKVALRIRAEKDGQGGWFWRL